MKLTEAETVNNVVNFINVYNTAVLLNTLSTLTRTERRYFFFWFLASHSALMAPHNHRETGKPKISKNFHSYCCIAYKVLRVFRCTPCTCHLTGRKGAPLTFVHSDYKVSCCEKIFIKKVLPFVNNRQSINCCTEM